MAAPAMSNPGPSCASENFDDFFCAAGIIERKALEGNASQPTKAVTECFEHPFTIVLRGG